jgi:hypothetical protein
MANTTNFGWETPDDTDLVKDGAAAIRTLGSSIDTSFVDLKGGTTGQVLSKATNSDLDYSWVTVQSGGMTQIATGTLSGAQINITSIPGTYKNLQLVVRNYLPATDGQDLWLRFNADSANRYNSGITSFAASNQTFGVNYIAIHNGVDNTVSNNLSVTNIFDYANATTWKMVDRTNVGVNATTNTNLNYSTGAGFYNQTAAITQINLLPQTGNFTSGTYILYGVS